jgi:hypothetical protein
MPLKCKRLDLIFPSLARDIATRHSCHGGEFGDRLDPVNDAEDRLRRSEHSASTHLQGSLAISQESGSRAVEIDKRAPLARRPLT